MRKPINDPKHLKNKILLTTYIFRCLPISHFWHITASQKELAKMQDTVKHLVQSGLLIKKPAISRHDFLYLTKKGYTFITTQVMGNSTSVPFYQLNEAHSLRIGITDHQYMNFTFLWHWLAKNTQLFTKDIKVYEDSNLNNCKIKVTFGGKDIVIAPDILIYLPDEDNKAFKKAIFIENDTGGETHRKIYQKLVEYSVLVNRGLRQNLISQAELYFIFHSQKRLDNILGENGIVRLFSYYNNSEKLKSVTVDTILHAFDGKSFPFYVGVLNQEQTDPYNFQPLNLKDHILQRRPEWKHLL